MPVHDEDPRAEDFRAVAQLAEAFSRTARQLTSDGGETLDAERVVEFAHRCMPRTQHTGLLLRRDGEVRTVAATSDVPRRLDDLRARVGEGPAVDAIETNDYVVVDDLPSDERWPELGGRAYDELGLRSVATYRLHLSSDRAAALTFLSDWPHAFDEMAIAIGAICAAYGSLALITEEIVGERVSHRRAVDAHREMGVAVGILLTSQDLSVEEAYRRLHRAGTSLPGPLAAADGEGGDAAGERR